MFCLSPEVGTGDVVFATSARHTKEIAMNTGSEITTVIGPIASGSLDGVGSGDHDTEYRFGRRPNALAPFPFTTRQFARLLVLRSRVDAGLCGADDF
jgi:hypothetical protein